MSSAPLPPLTLEQKAALVAGASTWTTTPIDGHLPALTLSDGPHGVRRQPVGGDNLGIGQSVPAVCFPPAVALGATWNPALVERVGAALGHEARALDVHALLGPGLNIKRSPLGGRNFEYLSEDPRLTGTLAAAMVRGIQSMKVAATPKHFAVNNQETDRMRVSATLSERALREIYLAAFEQVVTEAEPWAMMSAYNRINGVFASENRWLLTDLLRDEWGFDGLVMSDWGAPYDQVAAVASGMDLEMPPSGHSARVVAGVRDGVIDESVLDLAISRLQQLAARTAGLPPVERDIAGAQTVALEAAREAITLLENDGTLPLDVTAAARVLVVGEFARTPRFQGGGSSRVVPPRVVSALEALRETAGSAQVDFAAGFTLDGAPDSSLPDAAVAAASGADVVLAFVGLSDVAESEGFDRTSLSLPADQIELLSRLYDAGTPVVVILSHGAVVELTSWRDGAAAILDGWLLGQEGGQAIADVVFGVVDPSGRLAESIPHRLEDTPSHLTFPGRDGEVVYGEDIFVGYRSYDTRGTDVAYPFGFGRSYTRFAFEDIVARSTGVNSWDVTVTVRNIGERAGAEVVQLYVGAESGAAAEVIRPVHELRGFAKVFLEPGEATTVTLPVSPRDLSFWNAREGRWEVAPGEYRIDVGSSSRDIHLTARVHSDGDGVVDPLRMTSTVEEWAEHPVGAELIQRMRAAFPADVSARAPELIAMVQSTPMVKIAAWGMGLDEQTLQRVVDTAAAQADRERS